MTGRSQHPAPPPELERVDAIMAAIRAELLSAMEQHQPMHSPHEGHSVIREELTRELWDHVCADTGRSANAAKEAIQVGAMAARYLYDLCGPDRLLPAIKGEHVDPATVARRVWDAVYRTSRSEVSEANAMALADIARIEVER